MIFGVSDFATSDPFFNAETIVASGMDFIEPGCAKVVALSNDDFTARANELAEKQIRVQSLNWFLPPELKVVGEQVDERKSRAFLETAISRSVLLGAKAIVFGSPASRSIPDGFSASRARQQLVAFCQLGADVIKEQKADIKLAIEHVNHTETNLINTFAEAFDLASEVNRPEVGLTADFYHFHIENESFQIMDEAAELICAVQVADPGSRVFPGAGGEVPGLVEFFAALKGASYSGGISVEATPRADLVQDCELAAETLQKAWSEA